MVVARPRRESSGASISVPGTTNGPPLSTTARAHSTPRTRYGGAHALRNQTHLLHALYPRSVRSVLWLWY
eukprot:3511495-Rhodomonas_salina.1